MREFGPNGVNQSPTHLLLLLPYDGTNGFLLWISPKMQQEKYGNNRNHMFFAKKIGFVAGHIYRILMGYFVAIK
jgi:hypothetical protein